VVISVLTGAAQTHLTSLLKSIEAHIIH